jgi:hypothetical protein
MLLGPFLACVCVLILVREEKFSIGPERNFLFAIEIELFPREFFSTPLPLSTPAQISVLTLVPPNPRVLKTGTKNRH